MNQLHLGFKQFLTRLLALLLVLFTLAPAALTPTTFAQDAEPASTDEGTAVALDLHVFLPLVTFNTDLTSAVVSESDGEFLAEEEDGDGYYDELSATILVDDASVEAAGRQLRYDDLPDGGEFAISGRRWTKRNLTYYFQNGTNDISSTQEKNALRSAFALWAGVTNLRFTEVSNRNRADIVILWGSGSHGDPYPFDGTNGVLAHAFYPPPNGGAIAGDAHFDDAERWTMSTRPNGSQPIDLVTVAAHEIGHSLGLAHSSVAGALMYPYYTGSHRYLHTDDINGIRYLYP